MLPFTSKKVNSHVILHQLVLQGFFFNKNFPSIMYMQIPANHFRVKACKEAKDHSQAIGYRHHLPQKKLSFCKRNEF